MWSELWPREAAVGSGPLWGQGYELWVHRPACRCSFRERATAKQILPVSLPVVTQIDLLGVSSQWKRIASLPVGLWRTS